MSQNAIESQPHGDHPAQPHGHHGIGHVVPLKILAAVFAALTVLTVITVAASEVNFGEFNLIIALVIAVIKASLVVLFFMHLIWDKPFNAIVFVGCLIFVGLFISLALLDSGQYHASVYVQEAPGIKDKNGSLRQMLGHESPAPESPPAATSTPAPPK